MADVFNGSKSSGISTWNSDNHYVERVMDNAAYTAAHPDDTLVLVGPPRYAGDGHLTAVGMIQAFQVSQQRNVTPMQTIGSNRSFFLSGKSAVQFQIGRLFVRGNNLLRALSDNAAKATLKFDEFGTPASKAHAANVMPDSENLAAAGGSGTGYVANLDSQLFLIPFGLKCEFRDKSGLCIGSFYLELCTINSFSVGVNAGQNMILENVSGLADRLVPAGGTTQAAGIGSEPQLAAANAKAKIWSPGP
jgi:hypothetical protein